MNLVGHVVLLSWIPVVLGIFAVVRPRRAVITSFLLAWMFLPVAGYDLQGLPEYTKSSATSVGVLLGTWIFDGQRFLKYRFNLIDVPVLVWCFMPFISSIAGGHGPVEGMSSVLMQTISWGAPYFIGRIYFDDLASMRELAAGFFIGGLVYMPFCLVEIRLSPQFHRWVYGFAQHAFGQTVRFSGYRPMVFMQHGLAVGLFMCSAALAGFWLWRSRSIAAIWGVPALWLVLGLSVTAVLCKSMGAVILMAMGAGVLILGRTFRTSVFVYVLAALPPVYLLVRTVGGWSGQILVDLAGFWGAERAGSLAARLGSEARLWELVQPDLLFGVGRFRYVLDGVVPDGMWLIALGCYGLVGLTAFASMLLAPPVVVARTFGGALWRHPLAAPALAVAVIVVLYMMDCIFNAMVNPVFVLMTGALGGLYVGVKKALKAAAAGSVPLAAPVGVGGAGGGLR